MAVIGQEERRTAGVEGDWICVGALGGSYGVRGEARLRSFTEQPTAIFSYSEIHKGPNGPLMHLTKVRATKDGFIVRLDGISTPEAVQALKGTRLFVPRTDLKPTGDDEFYLADLIGLKAVDEVGIEKGFVRAVENFGAGDLLELVMQDPVPGLGRYIYVPFTKLLVPGVDITAGSVTIAFDEWAKTQTGDTQEKG